MKKLLLIAGTALTFIAHAASEVEVFNASPKAVWVGVFYTTKQHTRIVQNEDGSIPKMFKLNSRERETLIQPQRRIGYDRDIVVYKSEPKNSTNTEFGRKYVNTTLILIPSDASYLNIGDLQFVSSAEITSSGIKKTG